MKKIIKKILNESEWYDDLVHSTGDLPFEVSTTPTNKPKNSNLFKVKTVWGYGDAVLRESFVFKSDDPNEFETFVNVCKFYIALFDSYNESGYERWQDVSRIAKSVGLGLGSYDEESVYGTPKDMSDFFFGGDYPAELDEIEIYYYDKGGVEYPVRLKYE
jgi:hypothetical protein